MHEVFHYLTYAAQTEEDTLRHSYEKVDNIHSLQNQDLVQDEEEKDSAQVNRRQIRPLHQGSQQFPHHDETQSE